MNLLRGEYFPAIATKVLVHYDQLYCDPNTIHDGDVVYCDTHHILTFKNILNQKNNLIIITHNSDHYLCDGTPMDGNGVSVDELVCYKKWYGQNVYSSKVFPLPIGFENLRWEASFGPKTYWLNRMDQENVDPKNLVYLNCNKNTNLQERQNCYDWAFKTKFVTVDDPNLSYVEYLKKIKQHKFILSPRGNGLDCHRTWEILKMKRVPILKREGRLETLYENLPVLFVDDWEDLCGFDLELMYQNYSFDNQQYLWFNYWSNLI